MATKHKYAAKDALKVINGSLFTELKMHRFDEPMRTKAHLFSVNGRYGRQFGVVLGGMNLSTGESSPQQTRIVMERCDIPAIPGVELCTQPYQGHRFQQQDSKIGPKDQASCFVADEIALTKLLRWYGGKTP